MAIIFQAHSGEARKEQLFREREKAAQSNYKPKTLFVPPARRLVYIRILLIHINVITDISEKYVDVNNKTRSSIVRLAFTSAH
jgi:hypothetical protein